MHCCQFKSRHCPQVTCQNCAPAVQATVDDWKIELTHRSALPRVSADWHFQCAQQQEKMALFGFSSRRELVGGLQPVRCLGPNP